MGKEDDVNDGLLREPVSPLAENCELCGGAVFLDFNCLMPTWGKILRAPICETCFAEAESDMHIAVKVIGERVIKKGLTPPLTFEQVGELIDEGR